MTSREVWRARAAFAIDRGLFVSLGASTKTSSWFMKMSICHIARVSPGIVAGMQPTLSFGMPGAPRSVG